VSKGCKYCLHEVFPKKFVNTTQYPLDDASLKMIDEKIVAANFAI
jgi:hypothetical protein